MDLDYFAFLFSLSKFVSMQYTSEGISDLRGSSQLTYDDLTAVYSYIHGMRNRQEVLVKE